MTSFEDLGINIKIVKAIHDMGWVEPTPVQVEAIPVGLDGRDIFAQAQTGTGKTGTYATIVLGRITAGGKKPAAIVLCPTRELANQVDEEVYKIAQYTRHRSVAIYGGASISDQMYKLRKGVDVVVGTPGRVKDMIERGSLDLTQITEVVLDEADRMLDMGFSEELDFIMEAVPEDRQTLLFSATMADSIKKLAFRFMTNPLELLVSKDEPCSDLVSQYYVQVSRGGKRERLEMIIENGYPKMLVFCQTKKMVDMLFEDLSLKYKVGAIHGDMPQAKREKTIRNFRNDRFEVLVATDVAARGLDVNNIDVVVNYDVPPDADTYLHRIGRTGRAGKEGSAISFVTKMEDNRIRMYERETGKRIMKIRLEDMAPIDKKPLDSMIVEDRSVSAKVRMSAPTTDREERDTRDIRASKEDSGESKFERAPREARSPREDKAPRDDDRAPRESRESRDRAPKEVRSPREDKAPRDDDKALRERKEPREPRELREPKESKKKETVSEMVPLQINLGRDDGFGRVQVAEFIKRNAKLDDDIVGRVGLGNTMSYVEVHGDYIDETIDIMMKCKNKGKNVFMQIAPTKVPYSEKECHKVVRQAGIMNGKLTANISDPYDSVSEESDSEEDKYSE